MNEQQAKQLAAECVEYFKDDDTTKVEASYYPPGKSWRVVLRTEERRTTFHELRDWKYVVRFHLASLRNA